MNNEQFVVAILKCPGIGLKKALDYIISNGLSVEKCYKNIEQVVSKDIFDSCLEQAKNQIELNKSKNINIITIFDSNYPSKLYTISDPVLYLYYKGDISLLNEESVAIIGTRHPSNNSINATKEITKEISKKYIVVSGLALGIDTIAHQTTIDNKGKTIAVLPAGVDNPQPTSNRKLAEEIISKKGLLVSEYSSGTALQTYNYAMRDRIQAALADAIIIPEAKENSGTMIAANKAYKECKKVYQLSGNNNKKIKEEITLDNYMKFIKDSVSENLIQEKNKKDKILDFSNSEQISLF